MAAPTVLSSVSGVSSTTNATTYSPALPTITIGKPVLMCVTSDGSTLLSTNSTDWEQVGALAESGGNVNGAVFLKRETTGSDTLVVNGGSEQYSHRGFCIDATGPFDVAVAAAQGSSTNSDPPNLAIYGSLDALLIAYRAGDAQVVPTVAPSGYSNLTSQVGGGAAGASTTTAERTAVGISSENPGTFTVASEQWVCFTIAIWNDAQMRWSAGDRHSQTTLSNNNLTATSTTPGGAGSSVRTTMSGGASGKVYFECVQNATDTFFGQALGFANATFDVFQNDDSSASPNAITAWSDGNVYMNNGSTPVGAWSSGPWSNGAVACVCIDTVAKKFWARTNSGNWNNSGSANPATGVGGYSITNAGPYYGIFTGNNTIGYTLQTATLTVPSGFTDLMATAGGGPTYTLAAAGASLSLGGQTVDLKAGRVLAAAGRTLGLAGQAVSLRRGYTLAAQGRSLSLSAGVVGLVANRKLVAQARTLTLTGQPVTLSLTRKLAAQGGALSLTAQPVTLTYAPITGRTLTAAAAALSLTAGAVNLVVGRRLSAGGRTMSLAAGDMALKASRNLPASGATLVLAAGAITMRRAKTLTAGGAVLALSAGAVAFKVCRVLQGDGASITLSAESVDLVWSGAPLWFPVAETPEAWAAEGARAETWTSDPAIEERWSSDPTASTPWTQTPTKPETWH